MSNRIAHAVALTASVGAGVYLGYKIAQILSETNAVQEKEGQKYLTEVDKAISSISWRALHPVARALTIGAPIVFWNLVTNFIWSGIIKLFPALI